LNEPNDLNNKLQKRIIPKSMTYLGEFRANFDTM